MAKFTLVLTLIVTQFLTWGGAPVYLCLGCDGSVRLDLGPGLCQCVDAHDHETVCDDACCCETHVSHPASDDSRRIGIFPAVNERCSDCTHIMVSVGEQPAIISATTVVDPCQSLMCVVAWPVECRWRFGLVRTDTDLPDRPSVSAPSLTLTVLSSVNLRC